MQYYCDGEEYEVDGISKIEKKNKDSKYTLYEKPVERLVRILMP